MADKFYLSEPWKAFRRAVLREHPGCVVPGCQKRATHLDHIKPMRRGGAPLDRANVQGLCHSHHSAKTARADGGFGNQVANQPPPLAVRGACVNGLPVDPTHRWRRPP